MRKGKTLGAVLSLLACTFSSQISFVAAQDSQKSRQPAVKKEGWIVPGRDSFNQVSKILEENIEDVNVTQKILKAQNEIFVELSGKTVEPFVKRKSAAQRFVIHGVTAFESKGHVFAYAVYLVPVSVIRGKNYWEKVYMGAMYSVFYLDENGDGIFESRYGSFNLPKLPEWVRRNG